MISILVCSVKPELLEQLKQNINQTIGVPFELLVHDNRQNAFGLCKVYNLLAAQAQFPFLCFVHEDVLFNTTSWGAIIQQLFESDGSIGVVGVAGSKYKSAFYSGWFTGQQSLDCAHIIHRYKSGDELISLRPYNAKDVEEVVCLDGVFICATKKVWEKVHFDELHLKGFHLYDLDFSLRAAQLCRVMVTYKVELIHITYGGDFGNQWMQTSIGFHQRMKTILPFTKLVAYKPETEVAIAKVTLDVLKRSRIAWQLKRQWIQLQQLSVIPALFYPVLKFLLYRPLRLKYIHKFFRTHG